MTSQLSKGKRLITLILGLKYFLFLRQMFQAGEEQPEQQFAWVLSNDHLKVNDSESWRFRRVGVHRNGSCEMTAGKSINTDSRCGLMRDTTGNLFRGDQTDRCTGETNTQQASLFQIMKAKTNLLWKAAQNLPVYLQDMHWDHAVE